MRYQTYKQKVNKVAEVLRSIFSHIVLCIVCVAALILTVTVLAIATGGIYGERDVPERMYYGDTLSYSARGILSSVKYEYGYIDEQGQVSWSSVQPEYPGTYRLRTVSRSLFGSTRHVKEYEYVIDPLPLEVAAAGDAFEWGEDIPIQAKVANGDRLVEYRLIRQESEGACVSVSVEPDSILICNEAGEDVTSAYVISTLDKTLQVLPRAVTITVRDIVYVYDGREKAPEGSFDGYTITAGSLGEGDTLRAECSAKLTECGSVENTPRMQVVSADGRDVTEYYALEIRSGRLIVTPRPLELLTESRERVYDGTAVTYDGYEMAEGALPLVNGHRIEGDFLVLTNVVENLPNRPTFRVLDEQDRDVTANYAISVTPGMLTVAPRKVTITTESGSWMYDGTEHALPGHTVGGEDGLVEGHVIPDGETLPLRNVGSLLNEREVAVLDADGNDVTGNYAITTQYGTLEVTPRRLTISTESGTWVYDGEEHSLPEVTYGEDGLAPNQRLKDKTTPVLLNVEKRENACADITILDENDNDVSANYIITTQYGTLEVTPRHLTISTESGTWLYDGKEHSLPEVTCGEDGLAPNQRLKDKTTPVLLNVEKQTNKCRDITILDKDRNDVTANYIVTTDFGTLEVVKRKITITTESGTWVYDGEKHSLPEVTCGEDGLAPNQRLKDKTTPVLLNVEKQTNKCRDITILDKDRNDVTANYIVTTDFGTLEVVKRKITITTESGTWVYDGEYHSKPDIAIGGDGLAPNQHLQNDTMWSIRDVGSIRNTCCTTIVDADGNDVTSNYDRTTSFGWLEVTPRPITIITESGTWVYDGKEHSKPNVIFGLDGLAPDQDRQDKNMPGLQNVGRVENNCCTIIVDKTGQDVTSNYDIRSISFGVLEVTPRPITITTDSAVWTYDGTYHSMPDIKYGGDGLAEGHDLKDKTTPSLRDVGKIENVCSTIILDADGNDVTYNYEVTTDFGTLEVVPRPITIITDSAVWTYDGTYHFMPDIKYGGDGFVKGHDLKDKTTPSLRDVGKIENVCSTIILDADGNDVTSNYEVTTEFGILEVIPRKVTIITGSHRWIYDGQEHSLPGVTCGGEDLAPGQRLLDETTPVIRDIGQIKNACCTTIVDADGTDVTANYIVTTDFGILEILPRRISITTESGSWVYDGQEHSLPQIMVSGYGLAPNQRLKETTMPTLRDVGKAINACADITILDADGNDVTANYEVSTDYGTIEVIRRKMVIITDSKTWVYDGLVHSMPYITYDVNDPAPGQRLKDPTTPTLRDVGKAINACADITILDADGNDVTANYDLSTNYGTLEVTPRRVTITTESGTWLYDGKDHALPHITYGEDDLAPDQHLKDASTPVLRDVGKVVNACRNTTILDARGRDVTANYIVTINYGTLEVTPRHLTITTESGTWLYDGKDHSLPEITYGEDGLAPDQGLRKAATPVLRDVGKVKNACADTTILDADGNDVTANYIVTLRFGTLEVTRRRITIITESGRWIYDGQFHSMPNIVFGEDGLAPDQELRDRTTASLRDVGKIPNTCSTDIVDANGISVTKNYTITTDFGTLEVIGDPNDLAETLIGYVTSSTSGKLYLRQNSLEDFIHNDGGLPSENGMTLPGGVSYNYLTTIALENAGLLGRHTATFSEMTLFMLPYFPRTVNGRYLTPVDGHTDDLLTDGYTVSFYDYMSYDWSSLQNMLGEYAPYEEEYRRFVYENYLGLDRATGEYLRGFMANNGLYASDPDIIRKVAVCIQNSAADNLNYDPRLDSEENRVVAFLSTYQEGVCRHYAEAATAVFRALGIPARYTEGFAVDVVAGQKTAIMTPGHAWVEVYLDGIGWIPVEVTGGSALPDPIEVELTPQFAHKEYDGTPLYAPNALEETDVLAELLAKGYTYTVVVSGQRTKVGTSMTYIEEFHLYDPSGRDVTEDRQFKFVYNTGSIRVINAALYVFPYQVSKYYDGKSATLSAECAVLSGSAGVEVRLTPLTEFTSMTRITISALNSSPEKYFSWKILVNGVDQSDAYTLIFAVPDWMAGGEYIPFEIKKRQIELSSASITKLDDGKELTAPGVTVSKGTLAEGDVLYAEAIGCLNEIGECVNEIGVIHIYNAQGKDVTDSYDIQLNPGKLSIVEASGKR